MFTQSSQILLGCLVVGLLAAVNAAGGGKLRRISIEKKSARIVNGTIITIEEAPFMVSLSLRYDMTTICGGTLISLQHVLTAAHCVENKTELEELIVVGGVSCRNEAGVQREIAQSFIHPNRRTRKLKTDVAVLKLDVPFKGSTKIKAQTKFCSAPPDVGEYIKVTGWGVTRGLRSSRDFVGEDLSQELRRVRVPIISHNDCQQRLGVRRARYLTNTNICAYKEYYDSCLSDSGGPGIYGDKLCVVVSWGVGCAYGGYPGVYTSVPAVLDFIQEKLKL